MKAGNIRLGTLGRVILLGVLWVTISAAGLWAQIGTQGTFTGTVKDSSSAVVPGATVTATNIATGVSQSVISNQDGLYRLPQLPPGHYRIQAEHAGFRTEAEGDVELTVSQTQEVDFTLQVGTNTETVTVIGEAPLVDTSTSTVSSLVTEQQVQDLPLNGRDYSQLLFLSPGVSNSWGGVNQGRGNPQFEIAGARATSTRYMMDGTELSGAGITSNSLPNTASSKLLGVEAIAEFNVVSNAGDASLGKEQGGEINMVTRSGTNDLHGSAYEFFRSKAFDSANYFNPDVLPLTRNNYGGSLGGPIIKNKLFFFANVEQYKDREEFAASSAVPTPAVLGVGFNGIEQIPTTATVSGQTVCQVTTINPVTGLQTNPNGTTTQLNPVQTAASFSILNFFPANIGAAHLAAAVPQHSGGCPTGAESVNVTPPQSINDTFVLGRIDYQISDKQSLFGRYLIQTGTRIESINDIPLNQLSQDNPLSAQLFTLGDRYVFSSGLLNQFTVSFNRGFYNITEKLQPGLTQAQVPSALALLPGATTAPTQLGTIAIGTVQSQNVGWSIFPGMNENTGGEFHSIGRNVYEADEQLSKNVGQHFLQGGVQFQRFFIADHGGTNPTGVLTIPALLEFAQGNFTSGSLTGVLPCCNNPFIAVRQFYIGTYLQDSYKIKPNLTLNLGLRWEFMSAEVERYNRFNNWYPVLGGDGACAPTISCFPAFPAFPFPASFSEPGLQFPAPNLTPHNNSGNWAPRIGFAWNVFGSGKTSVRGGFGLFYNQIQVNPSAIPPFFAAATVNASATAPLPWPTPGAILQGAAAAPSVTLTGTVPNPSVPTMLQYNLTVQQQVASNTTLTVSYVGNEGYHNARTGDANLPAPIVNAAGQLAFPSMTTLSKTASGSLAVSPGALTLYDANSNYNSLQATLEKRLSRGLQVKGVFAWSKGLDEAPDPTAGSPVGIVATSILQDPRYDKGLTPYNVGKAFTLNWIYQLPTGDHKGLLGLAISNWEFDGIYHQQSGLPFSVVDGISQIFTGAGSSSFNASGRPNYNPAFTGPIINGGSAERFGPQLVRYFNPGAFTPAPYGVLGNVSSGALSGPGLANVDISLVKYINFTERYGLQFRVDAFNVLNHPNFSLPSNSLFTGVVNSNVASGFTAANSCFVGSATGTGIATTTACGQTQYAGGQITPVGVAAGSSAGLISSTATDNRELQFALKFIF